MFVYVCAALLIKSDHGIMGFLGVCAEDSISEALPWVVPSTAGRGVSFGSSG